MVEVDTTGVVRYANPEARARFPEILEEGWRHPLLSGIPSVVGGFATGRSEYVSREVNLEEGVFEQKICFGRNGSETVFRIYVHDVTALRNAEAEMEKLANRLAMAQEEERHRISRELHDEAGQALAALKLSMQLLRDDITAASPHVAPSFDQLIDLVEATRQQIRTIAHDLRPQALDAVGLDRAMAQLCADFATMSAMEVTYEGVDLNLSDAEEVCIYRVAQEALANVATHANASAVAVRLDVHGDWVELRIDDNGRGFDVEKVLASSRSGLGLKGMKERLEVLRGQLQIESELGMGTRVSATLSAQ